MNIYVSHLSWGTSSEGLGNLFMQFGEVASANVITDRETGRSRGFGFVEMPNEEEGQKAIDQLNGTSFEGQTITVNVARPREERFFGRLRRQSRRRLRRQPWRRLRRQRRRLRSQPVLIPDFISERISGRAFLPIPYGAGRFYRPVFAFPYFPHAQRHREKERKNYPRDLCFSRKKR